MDAYVSAAGLVVVDQIVNVDVYSVRDGCSHVR